MRVAIVGSRNYPDLTKVHDYIAKLPEGTIIVSGGAIGVDRAAVEAAKCLGFEYEEYLADWDRLGRRAGYTRNEIMLGTVDRVVAFWDGQSKGTCHAIDIATRLNLPLEIRR